MGRENSGRHKKTTKDFPNNWQTVVVEMMGEGASQGEVQAYIDVSDKTFTRILKEDRIFFRTIKRGLRLSRAWWERQGRTNLTSKEFNFVGWYMNMKNRFGWRDRKDITSNDKQLPEPIYGSKSTK